MDILTSALTSNNLSIVSNIPIIHRYFLWLEHAKPGQEFTYYIGNSPAETFIGNKISMLIMDHYNNGLVIPLRKRLGPFKFDHFVRRVSSNSKKATAHG